jgi:hypothetical protein
MRLESRQVDKWHYKGAWATELVYAVLADEWRARSAEVSAPLVIRQIRPE